MGSTRTTYALVLTALLLASVVGCAGEDSDAEPATPQALAAAVQAHYDEPAVVAVAPLFRGDSVRRRDVAVELAFDRGVGDNTHVRVVVSDRLPFDSAEDPCDGSWECLDVSTEEAAATLLYEPGHPEEDPGIVLAWSTREDHTVWAYANGPFVAPEDEGGPDEEVRALGDALAAIVTDPAVGRRTSRAYAEAGAAICAGDDWLRWYGEGNGAPRPQDFRDWCS